MQGINASMDYICNGGYASRNFVDKTDLALHESKRCIKINQTTSLYSTSAFMECKVSALPPKFLSVCTQHKIEYLILHLFIEYLKYIVLQCYIKNYFFTHFTTSSTIVSLP